MSTQNLATCDPAEFAKDSFGILHRTRATCSSSHSPVGQMLMKAALRVGASPDENQAPEAQFAMRKAVDALFAKIDGFAAGLQKASPTGSKPAAPAVDDLVTTLYGSPNDGVPIPSDVKGDDDSPGAILAWAMRNGLSVADLLAAQRRAPGSLR